MTIKPSFCAQCPINDLTTGYVPLCPSKIPSSELLVGEAAGEEEASKGKPFIGGAGSWLNSMLKSARLPRDKYNVINILGCRPPNNVFPTAPDFPKQYRQHGKDAIRYCLDHHFWPQVNALAPSRIIALGDQALKVLTGRRGILMWRGSPLPLKQQDGTLTSKPKVIATLHPAYLMRQSNMFSVAVGDLRKSLEIPPENYSLYPTLEEVQSFRATQFTFDFEWDSSNNITMCGLSDTYYKALVVPFCKPFIAELKRIFENAEAIIGHNIVGADTKYFESLGWNVKAKLYDTMLAQHLIQPDMRHSLAFVSSVFTNKVFWKGQGEETEDEDGNILPTGAQWKTWDSPDALPRSLGGYGGCVSADEAYRLYNARDTDTNNQLWEPVFRTLKNFGMEYVYWNVSVPIAHICRSIGDIGLKTNRNGIVAIREELTREIDRLELTLPKGLAPYGKPVTCFKEAPQDYYKPKSFKCKGNKRHNSTHEIVRWTDDVGQTGVSECGRCRARFKYKPIKLKRIKVNGFKIVKPYASAKQLLEYAKSTGCKDVAHSKTSNPTSDKRARKIWGRERTEFTIVDALRKLKTQKDSFAKEGLTKVDRVYFDLITIGTSEGRLSCKGHRRGTDPNIQQQPKSIRKMYIPDQSGYGFISADIIQGENMLTAWLAQDFQRLERLRTPGYDEHCSMAQLFFNCSVGKDDPLRKPGKIINHGRNYGLGVKKTVDYLAAEGFYYTQSDVAEMIEIWKKANARTAQWQNETIEQAKIQGYLVNAFGRKRWFQSRDFATKALAFLPASTLADVVLRMMIALHPQQFAEELLSLRLEATSELLEGWRLAIQVHDELVLHGPNESHLDMSDRLRRVMCQSWKELDGFSLGVEVKWSDKSWGDVKSI